MKYRTFLILTFAFALLLTIGVIKQVAEAAKSVEYAFETELGKIIAPIKADKDKNASNGQFVSAPAGVGNFVGAVEFKILIPKKADYYIWGKVIGTDGGNDSTMTRILFCYPFIDKIYSVCAVTPNQLRRSD